jgi:hypothetical protein
MNKNERIEKLNMAGINTEKYFTLNVSECIPAGAKIQLLGGGRTLSLTHNGETWSCLNK